MVDFTMVSPDKLIVTELGPEVTGLPLLSSPEAVAVLVTEPLVTSPLVVV